MDSRIQTCLFDILNSIEEIEFFWAINRETFLSIRTTKKRNVLSKEA